ncbi:MAG: U32 family peptidase [Candidatus Cryptobacteroides sp.]
MRYLELLAPAKNVDIGIAAIDCGADAVYIAGPSFGARQAAGNSVDDIRTLCSYAHRFGARVFITINTIIYNHELESARDLMLQVQDAGADAIIVQDTALLELARGDNGRGLPELEIPLHASTQCAIRDIDTALMYRDLGFSRLVLERELPLEAVQRIYEATGSEIEFFVHGALCVCYSGQCYMSEAVTGRSANRGECVQACRSLYDLADGDGKILVRNKALLSLKDYNLLRRLGDLAEAGVTSFKIEGRLKNISYVRNVTRAYSSALDALVEAHPESYRRASFGKVSGGFTPDLNKTFNRGYTELFLDGKRGRWASLDAPKGMGEAIGTVKNARLSGKDMMDITMDLNAAGKASPLRNGDGFAFIGRDSSITGFRGDVCRGNVIRCRAVSGLKTGMTVYRNVSTEFEKVLESGKCLRLISVEADMSIYIREDGEFVLGCSAVSQDGRAVSREFACGHEKAENPDRMLATFRSQMGKKTGTYSFSARKITSESGCLPFVSPSFINGIRRSLAEMLDAMPCMTNPIANSRLSCESGSPGAMAGRIADYRFNISNRLARGVYENIGASRIDDAYEISHISGAELMRTKYCIRYELGMCLRGLDGNLKDHGTSFCTEKTSGPLFLLNNGRRFVLHFDCTRCEMTVTEG